MELAMRSAQTEMATRKTAATKAPVKRAAKKAAAKKSGLKKATAADLAEAPLAEEAVQASPVGEEAPAEEKPKTKRVVTTLTEAAKRKLVRTLIKQTAEKLEHESGKTTMSDLIRLLSLEKELGKEKPTKITVQWIDPRTGKPWLKEN